MLKKIDEIFSLWLDGEGPGGQLLVTHHGKVIVEKCYGYSNLETKTRMSQDSVFPVASISKPVTAMCAWILYERGQLDVDADVRKYIPDLIGFSQPVTVRQMIHHISGLRGHYDLLYLSGRSSVDCLWQDEMLRLNARQKHLNFEPGQEFQYSNPNYVYLAEIIERISGMTLNQFATENIFKPLGMHDSFYRDVPNMLIPNRVSGYNDNGYSYINAFINVGMYGSTSLHTTCRDLTRFMAEYMEPTLISRKTLDEQVLQIPVLGNGGTTYYAGGVRINDLLGYRYIHHGGVNPGIRTFGMVIPSEELIVTVFTNTTHMNIERAGRDVARVVLGLPARTPKDMSQYATDTVDLSDISGTYFNEGSNTLLDLQAQEGQVYADGVKLTHLGGNLYQKGRLEEIYALGSTCVVNDGGSVMTLRKLTQTAPEEYMRACVGEYYADEVQGHFAVAFEGGKLYLDNLRHGREELHWMEGDIFRYGGGRKITFCRQGDAVTGFSYASNGEIRDLSFVKL